MIPAPFPVSPGDRLRVTVDNPYESGLLTGDLVTVLEAGIKVDGPGGLPIPVVIVASSVGRFILALDVVEPAEAETTSLPTYTPAEPDDVTDAFLAKMIEADPELGHVFAQAEADLSAMDAAAEQLNPPEASSGGTATAVANRRLVGRPYTFTDADDDELEVNYFEQDCPGHGREGGFLFTISQDEDQTAVVIPADSIDGLIRFLYQMKKHSERPPS